ncbi:hypothetical protein BWP39_21025 [Paraburkholderia acidicola]|uniref:Uncharacterized protein n=1 Tax=Paraburkholderia acidicola TaxID=1912599 RepID=A0A2A4EPW4_9BURK|nr:hypothetical protein [Paraburkholderia acidicola]PCE22159.1 hypothetical protein BWP39_21025 [Paraburkholderia acidicola]
MKLVIVDMLRVHLMAACFAAMGIQVVALLALLVSPLSEQTFDSTAFRICAIVMIGIAVIGARRFAQLAYDAAVQSAHATVQTHRARPVAVSHDCPRRELVVLHLRFTGRPFVLAKS